MHPHDRTITGELLATVAAALDHALWAASADTAEVAARYHRVGHANLQVAARLLHHLNASAKMISSGAAATESSNVGSVDRGAFDVGTENVMAANDGEHPVTNSGIPGVSYPAGTGAQGSSGSMRPQSGEFGEVHVSWGFDSSQPGTGYDVVQGQASTNNDGNPMVDPVSKADQTQNVGAGHVAGPSHPNAGS